MQNKIRKNINPENFLRNAKQEFSCQSLESFIGEYYNMENKIRDFRFKPVLCAPTKLVQITALEATKMKQKSSMTDGVHQQNGAPVKNMKRYQPVKNACAVTKFRQLMHFI